MLAFSVQYNPNMKTIISILFKNLEKQFTEIGREALASALNSWLSEEGFNVDGKPVAWSKETDLNPTMLDTGHLHSSMDYKSLGGDKSDEFILFAKNDPYPNRPDRTAAQVSGYHKSDFPHTNIPKQYRPGGSIYTEKLTSAIATDIRKLIDNGKEGITPSIEIVLR